MVAGVRLYPDLEAFGHCGQRFKPEYSEISKKKWGNYVDRRQQVII
jgi:hypothetical protein